MKKPDDILENIHKIKNDLISQITGDKHLSVIRFSEVIHDVIAAVVMLLEERVPLESIYLMLYHPDSHLNIEKLLSVISSHSTLKKIALTNHEFNDGEIRLLSTIIENNLNLMTLKLDTVEIDNEKAKYLSISLGKNRCLIELELSTNKMSPTGVVCFSQALKENNTIRVLKIINNTISIEGCMALVDALYVNHVEVLDLTSGNLGNRGAVCLATFLQTNKRLLSIRLNNNRMNAGGFFPLAIALMRNNSLTYFSYAYNKIGSDEDIFRMNHLVQNHTIRNLHLSNCNIGKYLERVPLDHMTSLTEIDLSSNHLKARSINYLVACLSNLSSLTKLNLEENELNDDDAEALAVAIERNKKFTHTFTLNLQNNHITDTGAECFAKILFEDSPFIVLNLSQNRITATGVEHFLNVLRTKRRTLTRLNLDSMALEPTMLAEIATICKQNTIQRESHEKNWGRLSILINFFRPHLTHPFRTSILALDKMFQDMIGYKPETPAINLNKFISTKYFVNQFTTATVVSVVKAENASSHKKRKVTSSSSAESI